MIENPLGGGFSQLEAHTYVTAVRSGRPLVLTERDVRMLAFMAEHRMVLERQVADLLRVPEARVQPRLRRLEAKGYLTRFCVYEKARCCRIRSRGLAAVGSPLPTPQLNLGMYRHDVGVAWLWLAAQRGAFGAAEVIGERRLRSHDTGSPGNPYAIRLGGYHGDGNERRHYPDLLLIDAQGRRLALELELTVKPLRRRESILAGYGADRRVDGVVYLVESHSQGRSIRRALQASVSRLGLSDRIRVQVVPPIEDRGRAPGASRSSSDLDRAAEGGR